MNEIPWDSPVLIEIVRTLPSCMFVLLLIAGALVFRRHLSDLLTRLTRLGALGVEVEFEKAAEKQLKAAFKSYATSENIVVPEKELEKILNRAARLRDLLNGSRILWVDDYPFANANIHRFLNEFGVHIDVARTTEDALAAMEWASSAYELIISDMVRGENRQAGIDLLIGVEQLKNEKGVDVRPVIIFVARLNPELGTPKGARLITDSVGELVQTAFDIIERHRS